MMLQEFPGSCYASIKVLWWK